MQYKFEKPLDKSEIRKYTELDKINQRGIIYDINNNNLHTDFRRMRIHLYHLS